MKEVQSEKRTRITCVIPTIWAKTSWSSSTPSWSQLCQNYKSPLKNLSSSIFSMNRLYFALKIQNGNICPFFYYVMHTFRSYRIYEQTYHRNLLYLLPVPYRKICISCHRFLLKHSIFYYNIWCILLGVSEYISNGIIDTYSICKQCK